MIADIDFRWAKRAEVRSKTPTFADTFPMEKVEIKVLQFRKFTHYNNDHGEVLTNWQDIPVVEE